MIVTPQDYTPSHEEEVSLEGPISEEAYRKIGQNNNWLIDLRPIGTIAFINVNQFGGKTPDNTIWQECDGSEIVNPDSPLRTIGLDQSFVPNMKDKYPRIAANDTDNPLAGTQNHDLAHNHPMGGPSSVGGGLDDKRNRYFRVVHAHAVAIQYATDQFFNFPLFVKYIAYMRVV